MGTENNICNAAANSFGNYTVTGTQDIDSLQTQVESEAKRITTFEESIRPTGQEVTEKNNTQYEKLADDMKKRLMASFEKYKKVFLLMKRFKKE